MSVDSMFIPAVDERVRRLNRGNKEYQAGQNQHGCAPGVRHLGNGQPARISIFAGAATPRFHTGLFITVRSRHR